MAFWWCLQHKQVEGDDGCAHAERLGPYDTRDDAARAIEHAAQRSKEWDRQDEEWEAR